MPTNSRFHLPDGVIEVARFGLRAATRRAIARAKRAGEVTIIGRHGRRLLYAATRQREKVR